MTGRMLEGIEALIGKAAGWVLVYGDTNLPSLVRWPRPLHIPVAHVGRSALAQPAMQRRSIAAVDRLSSLLLCPTQTAEKLRG